MTRKLLIVVTTAALAIGAATPAHAADPTLESGAAWLQAQLVDDTMPGFFGTDWGLTIDALIALRAANAKPATANKIADAVAASAMDNYATGTSFGEPSLIDGGPMAKTLFAAVAAGRDPLNFGGHNLRQLTLNQIDSDGWIRDSYNGAFDQFGNTFDQSLAVLGFARSGGVPSKALEFLLKQQCDAGGFPIQLEENPSSTCDPDPDAANPGLDAWKPDVDATAMAAQALFAAGKTAEAGDAVSWLLSVQGADGGFAANGSKTTPGNTNSTGLSGQALYAGGKELAAEKAAAFVRANQLTTANAGAASAHLGAIAWTHEVLTAAAANGLPDNELDQWRRATTQALLGMSKVPMGRIGIDTPPTTAPSPSASVSVSASAPPASLPVTGVSVTGFAAAGAGALLAGVVLLLVARRRRELAE